MKKYMMLILFSLLFVSNVYAASTCSYEEQRDLEQKAANIKISYEAKERYIGDPEEYQRNGYDPVVENYFEISFLNVTDDLYVLLKYANDDDFKMELTSSMANSDGVIVYETTKVNEIVNYNIEVYASSKTSCSGDKYKTFYLTTPRFNKYSKSVSCQELTDFYLCNKFVSFSYEITESQFLQQIEDYRYKKENNNGNNLENNFLKEAFSFINENKVLIIVIIAFASAPVIVIRLKRKKESVVKHEK